MTQIRYEVCICIKCMFPNFRQKVQGILVVTGMVLESKICYVNFSLTYGIFCYCVGDRHCETVEQNLANIICVYYISNKIKLCSQIVRSFYKKKNKSNLLFKKYSVFYFLAIIIRHTSISYLQ